MAEARDDSEFIGALYLTNRTSLYSCAYSFVKDPYLAEDIVDETFAHALSHCDWIRSIEAARRVMYLRKITQNLCIDIIRRQKIIPFVPFEEQNWDQSSNYDSWLNRIVERETIKQYLKCIEGTIQKTMYNRYFYGYTVKEISLIENISEAAVLQRLSRGRKIIREMVNSHAGKKNNKKTSKIKEHEK